MTPDPFSVLADDGAVVDTFDTADCVGLSITGGASLTIDQTNADPVPLVGLFADEPTIALTGPAPSTPVVTTATAVTVGYADVEHPASTTVVDQMTGGQNVFAVSGTTLAAFPPTTGADVSFYVGPAATLALVGDQQIDSLEVASGGTARLAASTGSTPNLADLGALTLDGPAAGDGGGVLDTTNNDLILRGTSEATTAGYLSAGYDYGCWDGISTGTGANPASIFSSSAANDPYLTHAIGYLPVGDGTGDWAPTSAYDGISVSAGDSVLRYTSYGDLNLDGVVDDTDQTLFNSSYEANDYSYASDYPTRYWKDGDLNYDGQVNNSDALDFSGTLFLYSDNLPIHRVSAAGQRGHAITVTVPNPQNNSGVTFDHADFFDSSRTKHTYNSSNSAIVVNNYHAGPPLTFDVTLPNDAEAGTYTVYVVINQGSVDMAVVKATINVTY